MSVSNASPLTALTDNVHLNLPLADKQATIADREQRVATLNDDKTRFLAALRKVGIAKLTVGFYGSGDEGNISNIVALSPRGFDRNKVLAKKYPHKPGPTKKKSRGSASHFLLPHTARGKTTKEDRASSRSMSPTTASRSTSRNATSQPTTSQPSGKPTATHTNRLHAKKPRSRTSITAIITQDQTSATCTILCVHARDLAVSTFLESPTEKHEPPA